MAASDNTGWDCHAHLFGPYARFPLAADRSYTPPEATPTYIMPGLVGWTDTLEMRPPVTAGPIRRGVMSALTALASAALPVESGDVAGAAAAGAFREAARWA